jgi:hypothetical protein
MKTLIILLLVGVTYAVAAPAFAGRDQTQMMAIQAAMEKKKAENLARAQQEQAGLAGATGVPGKVGPGTQKPRAGRPEPSAHP